MAAVSSSRQRGGGEGISWEHRRNRSEDNKQNFSLPYQVPSPPQSPLDQNEFVSSGTKAMPGRSAQPELDGHAGNGPDDALYQRGYQQRSNGGIPATRMRQPSQPEGRQERSYNAAAASRPAKKWNMDKTRDDESNWVHRDKLIALEIQDHIDRGERVPKALLEAQAQATSGGQYYSNQHEAEDDLTEHDFHQLVNTPPAEDSRDDYDDGYIPDDPRTPDEIASDTKHGSSGSAYYSPGARSGTSRIPVSKTGTRSRSQSAGSQVLLDEFEPPDTPPSPSQQRRAKQTHSRKVSGTERSFKSRAASGGAGSISRPTTANEPPRGEYSTDGTAPWLDEIYKPDPKLPPDQQILPTHAKRIHQEQLAREEAERQRERDQIERERQRELDRERDRMEREREREMRRKAATDRAAAEKAREEQELRQREMRIEEERMEIEKPPPSSQPVHQQATFPERFDSMKPTGPPTPSAGSEHGGYRTMPKVQGTPATPTTPTPNLRAQESMRIQDPDAAAQKKGCGCCVVM